jgi:single-strand DNA-binding protein
MSKHLNKVTLIGTVGKDPTIRYTAGGAPVASFSLATSERWNDKAGQRQEATQWHSIVAFGKTAEIVRDYVLKGSPLYVEGKLKYSDYLNKDSVKVYKTEIEIGNHGSQLILLPSAKKADATPSDAAEPFSADSEDAPF